jgi:choice-of-anchor B domain-containing protein
MPCVDGFVNLNGENYPCLNVDLLSFLSFTDLGCPGAQGNDVWGWSKEGRDFAIFGCTSGTSFVEITDPQNPRTIGFLPTTTTASTWRDMKVFSDHAYIVSEARGHGLQVFDLTRLLNEPNPGPTNRYDPDTLFFDGMGNTTQRSTHNLHCNEDSGYCYLVGCKTCRGGLLMVNVQDPKNPQLAGCFADDGYTHDTQCVIYYGPDHRFQGKEICFASNEDSLTIVDVTNKDNPVMLSWTPYYGVSYCHQAWLSENQAFLFMDDELDEMYNTFDTTKKTVTYVWDVSDLTEPLNFAYFQSPVQSIDHNQYVRGNHVYQANYASGLRIWRGIQTARNSPTWKPELIGFFDVHPDADVAQFYGSWSVYPYYTSTINTHTAALTSIEKGLFIVQFNREVFP